MHALERKSLRDLSTMRGQVITIAVVIACGVAAYVSLQSAHTIVSGSMQRFYAERRFADLFAKVERAPNTIEARLRVVPGVVRVQTRVTGNGLIPLSDSPEPGVVRALSIPDDGVPELNDVHVRMGRLPEAGRANEVVLSDAFAESHHIVPGDPLNVVLSGSLRRLRVVGIGTAPDYLIAAGGSDVTSMGNERFAAIWMRRNVLAPWLSRAGAFDDVALSVDAHADPLTVADTVQRILAPYGCISVQQRKDQYSHRVMQMKLANIQSMAGSVPVLFLAVAAFLVNVVLGRLVRLQRMQIAMLKAVGYGAARISFHYVTMGLLIALLGTALGTWMGNAFATYLINIYAEYFRIPGMVPGISPDLAVRATLLSASMATLGALTAVRSVVSLPPAQAMQPDTPDTYAVSAIEDVLVPPRISVIGRMVVRELLRRPLRLVLSSVGIAGATALLVTGLSMNGAIAYMLDALFHRAMHDSVSVTFARPEPLASLQALHALPGVRAVEPLRTLPLRVQAGWRSRDVSLLAHADDARLRPLLDRELHRIPLPEGSFVMTRTLAELLGIRPGDSVQVEALEGEHVRRTAVLTGTIDEVFGLQIHMRISDAAGLFSQAPSADTALLAVDAGAIDSVVTRLARRPGISGMGTQRAVLARFEAQTAKSMGTTTLIIALFSAAIAAGVVYNNARVALALRARDLATLRVLGFTRAEVSSILLGEMTVQSLLGALPGLPLGRRLAWSMFNSGDPERYRLPIVVPPETYLLALFVTLFAAAVSALVVRRRIDTLDLVGVLKTRE